MPHTAPSAMEPANALSAWTRILVHWRGKVSVRAPSPRSPGHAIMGWALQWCPPTMPRGPNPFGQHSVCALLAVLRGTCTSA